MGVRFITAGRWDGVGARDRAPARPRADEQERPLLTAQHPQHVLGRRVELEPVAHTRILPPADAQSSSRPTTAHAGADTVPPMATLLAPPAFLILPTDPGYDEARRAWNLAADQRPAAVARAETAADVVAAVRHAREHGLRVTAQGTGHGALSLGDLEDTLLIRTDRMRGVTIDAEYRVARVEAGAQWQDVIAPAAEHGLACLHGSAPDVGVVGYTLGGGLSFYGRRYGTAASRLLAVELVTADGELVRADRRVNADLFRALQGGGGAFGVVTAMEFELFEPGPIQAGHLWFSLERGREVFKAWAKWVPSLPRTATSIARVLRVPDIDGPPPHLRGKEFALIETIILGTPEEADALLAPVRALAPAMDTTAPCAIENLQHLHMDPPGPVPSQGEHVGLPAMTDAAVDALFDSLGPALLGVQVMAGGERVASLGGPYLLFAVGMAATPAMQAAVRADLAVLRAALRPFAGTRRYANFVEDLDAAPAELWDRDTLTHLRAVKLAVDPGGIIQTNHSIA